MATPSNPVSVSEALQQPKQVPARGESEVNVGEEGVQIGGVEQTGMIDALKYDEEAGEVVLIMVEPRPWDGSELQLFQLQEKFNAYLSFALDGEMQDSYPMLIGKPLRIVLNCASEPDGMARQLLRMIRDQIAFQGIKLEVRAAAVASVRAEDAGEATGESGGSCGHGCGCHGG